MKRRSDEGQTGKQWAAVERACIASFKHLGLLQPVSSTDMDMESLAN